MSEHTVEIGADGDIEGGSHPAGEDHVFVVRTLDVERRYHDDSPVQGALAILALSSGVELTTELDEEGRGRFLGVPESGGEVRFGPDARAFERVDQTPNPDHETSKAPDYVDQLLERYGLGG